MSANIHEPITVSVSVLSQLFSYLTARGIDPDEFLATLNVDPELVRSPDTRLPIEKYLYIEDEAVKYSGDEFLGLHMGEFVEAGSWSILGYMMVNCRTLGEAFEKAGRYSRVIGNLIDSKIEIGLNKVKVVMFTPPHAPRMSRQCFESVLSSTVRIMRSMSGQPLDPLEVEFNYPAPSSTAEYERIFRCPVHFERKKISITLDMSVAKIPVLYANPAMLDYFENYAQEFLAEMEREDEYTQAVTRILLERMDDVNLSIEKVAREMAVSVRTLQKRLEQEGVVFSDLMRETRHRLAKKYLRQNYTVEQITYMLGFSEPSVFRKAFKKWSGITPREYRESGG